MGLGGGGGALYKRHSEREVTHANPVFGRSPG